MSVLCGQRQIKTWQVLPTVQRHLHPKVQLMPPWAELPGSSAVPEGSGKSGCGSQVWFAHIPSLHQECGQCL